MKVLLLFRSITRSLRTRSAVATAAVIVCFGATVRADEQAGGPKGEKAKPEMSGQERERWDSLSEEEREKLKKALREVWTDPGVLSAREEVNQSSRAFQEAIRAAIAKADPSVAPILKQLQGQKPPYASGRPPGPVPGGRMGMRKGGGYATGSMGSPGFLERLTAEERERFKAAEESAKRSEKVTALNGELSELQKQGETLRKKRMETHLQMRKAILAAMLQEDPGLKEILAELELPRRSKEDGRKEKGPSGKGASGEGAPD